LGRDYSRHSDISDEVSAAIDEEVRHLITQAHNEAREILTTHEDALHRIAEVLIDRETVDATEVAKIFEDVPKWEHTGNGPLRIQNPASKELTGGGVAALHSETNQ